MPRFFLGEGVDYHGGARRYLAGRFPAWRPALEGGPVAKKKSESVAPESRPDPGGRRNVVSIRGTVEWRDWLMGLADHRRLAAADVIDQALIEHAQKHGYAPPAPRR